MSTGFSCWQDAPQIHGRCVSGGLFHIISVDDMDKSLGKENQGNPKYCAELYNDGRHDQCFTDQTPTGIPRLS